jgi:hypothetical protein
MMGCSCAYTKQEPRKIETNEIMQSRRHMARTFDHVMGVSKSDECVLLIKMCPFDVASLVGGMGGRIVGAD